MRTPRTQAIEALLAGGAFLAAVSIESLDSLLDGRDVGAFDLEWREAFAGIPAKASLSTADLEILDQVRERAFKAAYRKTGSPDFAGYVCDDFELIVLSELTKTASSFADEMLRVYERGGFPSAPSSPKGSE